MIRRAAETEFSEIADYIGSRYMEAPYLYLNLKKYGVSDPSVPVLVDRGKDGICGVYLMYYDCLHFLTWEKDYPEDVFLQMVQEQNPKVIMAPEQFGANVSESLKETFQLVRMRRAAINPYPAGGVLAGGFFLRKSRMFHISQS